MKTKLGGLLVAVAMFTGLTAKAIYNPYWERPIYDAKLTELSDPAVTYPNPEVLTLTRRDGSVQPTGFVLRVDTGVRCITTPCPSSEDIFFKMTGVSMRRDGSVLYTAQEAQRGSLDSETELLDQTVTLVDMTHSMIEHDANTWHLTITNQGKSRHFVGKPEPVITIQ